MSSKGKLSFVVGLFSFVILSGLYFALRTWMPFMWVFLALSIFGILIWVYLDRNILHNFFTTKTTRHGLNMGALVLIVLGLLATINFVGARHYATLDFSTNKLNTLSPQSLQLLKGLDSPLNAYFFYKNGSDRVEENKKVFRDLVKKYQDVSAQVKIQFIEMNEMAKLTQDFSASRGSGEAFIEYKGLRNRIENYTEQDLTNALIKLTRTSKKIIYFVEGHEERNLDLDKDETSLFGLKQLLEKNSYEVKKLSLVKEGKIPPGAEVLIIAGPTQNFQDFEIKLIKKFLENGGALLLAVEAKFQGLDHFIKDFGLSFNGNYIFNVFDTPMGQVVNAQSATVAVNYSASSEITKAFTANQMTVFKQPTAINILSTPTDMQTEVLVKTPDNSVALQKLDSADYIGKPQTYNLAVEVKGKLSPEQKKDFRLIVFSDVDFMSNVLLYQNLNRDLILNTISYLAQEKDLISISPKETQVTKILLSPPEFNQFFRFVIFGIIIPIPLLFMMASLIVWFRRRHA